MQTAVERFAAGLGYEAHLLVSYEALLLTVIAGGEFRTKVGPHVAGLTVDMTAVDALNRITDEVAEGRSALPRLRVRLAALENHRPSYPRLARGRRARAHRSESLLALRR